MSPGLVSPRSSPFSTRGPGRSPALAATPWFLYLRCPWPCVLCALIPGRTAERRHRTPQPRPAPAATVLTSRDWPASAPALRPTPSAPPRRPLVGASQKPPEEAAAYWLAVPSLRFSSDFRFVRPFPVRRVRLRRGSLLLVSRFHRRHFCCKDGQRT